MRGSCFCNCIPGLFELFHCAVELFGALLLRFFRVGGEPGLFDELQSRLYFLTLPLPFHALAANVARENPDEGDEDQREKESGFHVLMRWPRTVPVKNQ